MHLPLLLAALQTVSVSVSSPEPDTTSDLPALAPDSADMATAYADDATRELVRLARTHHEAFDADVFHYTATARQRVSAGLRALRRDRVLFRQEIVGRVEWWRDRPARVTVEGARQAVPVAMPGVQVPESLRGMARDLVISPRDDRLLVNPVGGGMAWHPLVEGGEAVYRYAIGDSTLLRLPDGREIRLLELRVTPRRRDIRLVTGSFWIELDRYGLVQATFRPSREFDLERDLPELSPEDAEDVDEVPGILKPIRFDVRYITVEYGLWEMRWWMPRLMAFDGWVQAGPMRMPLTFEVGYSDYTVEPDRWGLPSLPPVIIELAGDPYTEARTFSYPTRVVIPEDSAALLESELLAGDFFRPDESMISEGELRELGRQLRALPPPPFEVARPVVTAPWTLGSGLARFNRVEGLSAGIRVDWDLTRVRLDLTGRIGVPEGAPRGELGLDLPALYRTWRLAGYHRLVAVDPGLRPFGVGNSVSGLLLGRDDGQYFQATGAELRVTPDVGSGRYELRLYAERQAAVERSTHASLPYLLGGDGFRPNLGADPADQLGLQARFGLDRGFDPVGWRGSVRVDLTAETGDVTFLRPGLLLRGGAPLPGPFLAVLELAGGTTVLADSARPAPAQSAWFLGGPATLRGFAGGALAGPDYGRARFELASAFPGARVALFSDAGWVGTFDTFARPDVALSVGAGASVVDGLVRLDLARAIQPGPAWRLDLYIDALF